VVANNAVAVFACVGSEVLDDDGDVLTLRDSAGTEVAVLRYGSPARTDVARRTANRTDHPSSRPRR
jgi:hypothetical protein